MSFYETDEWRMIRYEALKRSRGCCECCGARGGEAILHVDHIKPRSKYPHLELVLSNLQVLCEACNLGKGNHDETDWRGLRRQWEEVALDGSNQEIIAFICRLVDRLADQRERK